MLKEKKILFWHCKIQGEAGFYNTPTLKEPMWTKMPYNLINFLKDSLTLDDKQGLDFDLIKCGSAHFFQNLYS